MRSSLVSVWAGPVTAFLLIAIVACISLPVINTYMTRTQAAPVIFLGAFAIAGLSVALTYGVKFIMSSFDSRRLSDHLKDVKGIDEVLRGRIVRKVRKTFWFDAYTRTVPAYYRRTAITAKTSRHGYWVMDVDRDFTQITLERYGPGERPSSPLSKPPNALTGYARYGELLAQNNGRRK